MDEDVPQPTDSSRTARPKPNEGPREIVPPQRGSLIDVIFDAGGAPAAVRKAPTGHQDRAQAARDLRLSGHFEPVGLTGPYRLHLSVRQTWLVFDIRDRDDQPLHTHALSLSPFRSLIKDYCMIVDSYEEAMAEGASARVQAIDMGRRGLHNEGAELMMERLRDKIEVDFETARRLFTILCVLYPNRPSNAA